MTVPSAQESYSFVCLRCGHAWEGTYEIRHSRDAQGRARTDYYVRCVKVPSPLTANTCRVCRGRTIRILRSGLVSSGRSCTD
ncbi:hypothetical protein [Streptomyces anandii]|uniref:hypothetical protein n=1 Tax=Streptomyces anandii TaxID=285454 RepID=UPI00167AE8CB|nr:hypothetical protein [Streptomyces anandii]GGY14417.1 hypothetical protein GCM10010510_70470 [Streptomyces anandii JCM 4720]